MYGNGYKDVTIISFGLGGVGKSALGNALLQEKVFVESDDPDSCTLQTNSQSRVIDGVKRHYIDTQGLKSADGLDESHIQQMINFLKNWTLGINAFFIVINIQNPRFDGGLQKMMSMLNDFFNNPNIWYQTAIVFTKCYSGHFDREPCESQYREKVINYIKELNGCSAINPSIPCFFVDSCEYEKDQSTKLEIERAFQFAQCQAPISSKSFVPVSPQYKEVKEEILSGVIVGEETKKVDGRIVHLIHRQNQRKIRYTDRYGNVTFSQPEALYNYTITEYPDKSKQLVIINDSSSNMVILGDIIV